MFSVEQGTYCNATTYQEYQCLNPSSHPQPFYIKEWERSVNYKEQLAWWKLQWYGFTLLVKESAFTWQLNVVSGSSVSVFTVVPIYKQLLNNLNMCKLIREVNRFFSGIYLSNAWQRLKFLSQIIRHHDPRATFFHSNTLNLVTTSSVYICATAK